ncbi:serine hydrolase domain-containing protein [Arachidicoccus sp.]|uniref:serine hydrolase domain-containing protein n=1 Tax=Arachidicoccus sp. TaxID=1872624 RepID=UPI003D2290C6
MKPSIILFAAILFFSISCGAKKNKENIESDNVQISSKVDTSIFQPLSKAKKEYYAARAEAAYHRILGSHFNGEILIAKNGQIVYEDYKGTADFRYHTPITPHTALHLASISKTLTGMTILHLWDEGKLSLDDNIQKFFPQFPYQGITIKMLLSHRTGLPNYVYFMEKGYPRNKYATNQDVINFMIVNKPKITSLPNRAFQYCNTNFLILASIIEKVTHQPFPRFMKDSVFQVLGMHDTYVFSIKDTANYNPTYQGNRPFPMTNVDCTYGDKNIYSTVRDLLKWDRSLYLHTFIKASTLKMAFTPQSHEHKSMHNYGLAWRTYFNPLTKDSIIYHNGYWHGSNNVFMHLMQDTATIILLGNKYNPNNYNAKKISEIFTGKADYGKLSN